MPTRMHANLFIHACMLMCTLAFNMHITLTGGPRHEDKVSQGGGGGLLEIMPPERGLVYSISKCKAIFETTVAFFIGELGEFF
jgi:hypothetical protein